MADAPYKLILLRHGESEWNAKNLFTGWVDVNLNEKGEKEAVRGGELLKDAGLLPDVVHTSLQKRAIRTAQLGAGGRRPPLDPGPPLLAPERAPLRRPPGQGQGPDPRRVRRGAVHALAPLLRHPAAGARRTTPSSPSSTTRATRRSRRSCARARSASRTSSSACSRTGTTASSRTSLTGRTVLVAAHGNSLRALVKHLDGISDADIAGLNIPTGIPLSYELDADFSPVNPGGTYLDPDAAAAAIEAVKNQGKKK